MSTPSHLAISPPTTPKRCATTRIAGRSSGRFTGALGNAGRLAGPAVALASSASDCEQGNPDGGWRLDGTLAAESLPRFREVATFRYRAQHPAVGKCCSRLSMTRLPMARRVSTVALPICSVERHCPCEKRLRHVRLILEHIKPGSAETAVPKRRDKSLFIDHGSARRPAFLRDQRLDHLAADGLRVSAPPASPRTAPRRPMPFRRDRQNSVGLARIAVVVADLRVKRFKLPCQRQADPARPRMPTRRLSAERAP